MKRIRTTEFAIFFGAAAVAAVVAVLFPGPAFGNSPASPPLSMEEIEVHGSGDVPERLFAPAPVPERPASPVQCDLLRERILAPISHWENDDEDRRTGIGRAERDDRD